MYTRALGPNGPLAWVYISGKSLMLMIQLTIIYIIYKLNSIVTLAKQKPQSNYANHNNSPTNNPASLNK